MLRYCEQYELRGDISCKKACEVYKECVLIENKEEDC